VVRRQCRKAGDEATAKVFEDTAAQEMLHASATPSCCSPTRR